MKKRITVISLVFFILISVFSIVLNGSEKNFSHLALAGYGGDSDDDDKDSKDPSLSHTAVLKAFVGEKIKLSARAKDKDSGIDRVTLRWRVLGGNWEKVKMKNSGSRYYFASIPAQKKEGIVEYYIKATDEEGNSEHEGKASKPFRVKILSKIVKKVSVAPVIVPKESVKTNDKKTDEVEASEKNEKNFVKGEVKGNKEKKEEKQEKQENFENDSFENQERENKWKDIFLGVLALAVLGGGIFFFLKK